MDSMIHSNLPDFFTKEQYITIMETIETKVKNKDGKKKYSIRDAIIIILMFTYGFRISEILGITYDDLHKEVDENGNEKYFIYLRNRVSDKPFQRAKNLDKVVCYDAYDSSDYKKSYEKICIFKELYDTIIDYIHEEHPVAREKFRSKYFEKTIADKVDIINCDSKLNFYVFLNQFGTPLSAITWDSTLKQILKDSNIVIKRGRALQINNLFRNGYAMLFVNNGIKLEELQKVMRSKSISSVQRFFVSDK